MAQGVQSAQGRVQSGGPASGGGLGIQHGVAERQHGVDRVTRRASVAAGGPQGRCKAAEKGLEIHGRSGTFEPAQLVQRVGASVCALQRGQDARQALLPVKKGLADVGPERCHVLQGGALALDFAVDDAVSQLGAGLRLAEGEYLLPAATGVVVRRAGDLGYLLATAPTQGNEVDPAVGQGAQHFAAELRVGAQNNAVQVFERQAAIGLAIGRGDVQHAGLNGELAALAVNV